RRRARTPRASGKAHPFVRPARRADPGELHRAVLRRGGAADRAHQRRARGQRLPDHAGRRGAAAGDRRAAGQGRALDAERGGRMGPLQRGLEPDRPARRLGTCGLLGGGPAAGRADRLAARPGGSAASARGPARARAPLGRPRAAGLRVSDPDALLELAIEAARLGGGLLVERAAGGAESSVASKSTPTDLVSEADVASQRAIRALLRERRPGDGFLGEEEGESETGTSGLRWIVDPLDGTINYLFGIPQWSVSVAVADGEGVLAGAVYDPNRSELFAASRSGAAVLEGERELDGRAADPGQAGEGLATAMVATGFAYDAGVREGQAR